MLVLGEHQLGEDFELCTANKLNAIHVAPCHGTPEYWDFVLLTVHTFEDFVPNQV
jgi:hypothetical protein